MGMNTVYYRDTNEKRPRLESGRFFVKPICMLGASVLEGVDVARMSIKG